MENKRSLVLFLRIAVVLFVLGVSAVGSSAQQPETNPPGTGLPDDLPPDTQSIFLEPAPAPATLGSGIVNKSALDFVPYLSSVTFGRTGIGIYNTAAFAANFETHLNLPHKATIRRVVVYFYDNDASYDLSADFNYHSYTDWGTYVFQEVNSSGASSGVRYAYANPTGPMTYVDGSIREYTVEVLLPPSSDVVLFAVRVDYGFETVLPAINR